MKAMSQMMNFGKSASDNGWGMFVNMLMYKAEEEGKHVVKANRQFPSSQMCHVCGTHHQRDWNSAINLRDEALHKELQ